MKSRPLPDWFAPAFAWTITILVLVTSATKPEGVYVNEELKFFPLLLAIAWTGGFVAMRQLKTAHPAEFEALGSPNLFGSPFEKRTWAFTGYFFGLRFLRLKDRVVSVGFGSMWLLTVLGALWLLFFPGATGPTSR